MLIVLLLIFIIALTYHRFYSVFKSNVIFSTVWLVSLLGAKQGWFDLRPVGGVVTAYAIAVVVVYNIVYFMVAKRNKGSWDFRVCDSFAKNINYRIVFVAGIIGLLLMMPIIFESLNWFRRGMTITEVRYILYASQEKLNMYEVFFFRSIPLSIFHAIAIIAIIDKFQNRKNTLMILSFITILISFIVLGGRFMIINPVFYILGYISIGFKSRISSLRIIVLGGILLVGLAIASFIRGQNVVRHGVIYYSGALTYLDLILGDKQMFGLDGAPLLGQLMLGFIVDPVLLILKVLFKIPTKVPSYFIDNFVHDYHNIGRDGVTILFNSNVSMLFSAIRDFGELGVIIYPAFLASIVAAVENAIRQKGQVVFMAIYMYLTAIIVNSVIRYGLMSTDSLIVVLMIVVFTIKMPKLWRRSINEI